MRYVAEKSSQFHPFPPPPGSPQEALASWDATIAEKAENNAKKKLEIEKGRIAYKEALAESMAEEQRKRDEQKHK